MTPQTHSSLKELQELDQEIASIESVVGTFDAKLEEVGEPVHRLEKELKGLQARLQEVTLEGEQAGVVHRGASRAVDEAPGADERRPERERRGCGACRAGNGPAGSRE